MTETKARPVTEAQLVAMQRRSMNNRAALSGRCGCFHCLSRFAADGVSSWTDDGQTALCPVCGIDAVLGSAAHPVSDDALSQMQHRWFGSVQAPSGPEWDQAVAVGDLPPARV